MTRLISRRTRHYKGKVYDLTVENTHTYNIEGIPVHNCGGSLVAYLLGITDVDPIRFDLLFERFINPERIDLPDIDLDFMSTRRGEVIEYIEGKYGKEYVAGIANFNTMASGSALRDAARAFGFSSDDMSCSKLVPKEHGKPYSLEQAREAVPEIQAFADRFPEVWGHALVLEGKMRSVGRHAAGVIVAGEPLANRAVVNREGAVTFDKTMVEDFGLIKLDVLGLETLDMLRIANDYIAKEYGHPIDLLAISLDDQATLENFGKGNTVAIFQFESGGMRRILKELGKTGGVTFGDLSAVTALYRPGPLDAGMVEDYLSIKKGFQDPEYDHPAMKPALEATGGIIIYQESVQRISKDLCGFTGPESDFLRRAISKKKKEEMEKMREKFVSGAVNHSGMNEAKARALFDKIDKFAGYSFCAAHSCEYAVVSYQAMYIKTHHPTAFFAASMSLEDDEVKLAALVEDAMKAGLRIMPPDVNKSGVNIEIDGNDLYLPFTKIKGCSDTTARMIVEARENPKVVEVPIPGTRRKIAKTLPAGPFESVEDFNLRVPGRVNSRQRDALMRIGAFASVDPSQIPATHPDRLRDQAELLPGVKIGEIKPDRRIVIDPYVKGEIAELYQRIRNCDKCGLCDAGHPMPRFGRSPKFMVVFDSPAYSDEEKDQIFQGKSHDELADIVRNLGIKPSEGYWTAYMKARKPKDQKQYAGDQVLACQPWLQREVELLKPPIIVCLGGSSSRFFVPDLKGSPEELAGKAVFDSRLDATIVFGPTPGTLYFRPEAAGWLEKTFSKLVDLLS